MHRWAAALTGVHGKQVPDQNLHITLAFLGPRNGAEGSAAHAVAAQIAGRGFTLRLDSLGHWRQPQVVWLAPTVVPAALQELESTLRRGLGQTGIEVDPRPFKPHLTLFRKVGRVPRALPVPHFDWPIADFRLVESVTHPQGVRYEILGSWPLIG
jgi:2'-5' RNA ligase